MTATESDHRITDRWPQVLAAANRYGIVDRPAIIAIYGGSEKSADAAISRWVKADRLWRRAPGVYELSPAAPSPEYTAWADHDYAVLGEWLINRFCPTHSIDTEKFDSGEQTLGAFIQDLLRRYAETVGGLRLELQDARLVDVLQKIRDDKETDQ